MKIVHVISLCGAGGAEVFVKSLIKELRSITEIDGIELWVMSSVENTATNDIKKVKFEKTFVDDLKKHGIAVKFINKKPGRDWIKTVKILREKYNLFKPDIVHTHLESVTFHVCRALAK